MVIFYLTGLIGEHPNTTVGFVHIDDVIAAHILAMEEPKASCIICSSSVAHWSQIIKCLGLNNLPISIRMQVSL
jgi:nucleoside-diphosphate-sugar epimerase